MTANRFTFHLVTPLPFVLALAGCGDQNTDGEELVDLSGALTVPAGDPVVAVYDDLTINVPTRFNVPYAGAARAEFPDGLPLSVGSGFRFRRHGPGLSFYGLTDRGPSADAPSYLDAAGVSHTTKAFAVPSFAPAILTVNVLPFLGPIVTSVMPIRSGGAAVDGQFPVGLSAEVDARGNIWLCEEYGPSLLKVHPRTGEILAKLTPGVGLPAVLVSRQNNRGFEGIAVAPTGRIYAMVQSTLDVAGSTKSKAQFLRLVEYDPSTGATRMFAYPHDIAQYAKSGDAKMGDLVAVDDHRFLVIEQGKDKNKAPRNLVYAIDIDGATDLTGRTLAGGANAGKELEYGTAAEIAAQVTTIRKSLVADIRGYDWTDEKAEGLSLVDDKTLVVTNDQDFGLTATMSGDATSTDPTAYVVDSTGALTINGVASPAKYELHATPVETHRSHALILRLQQPITTYCP